MRACKQIIVIILLCFLPAGCGGGTEVTPPVISADAVQAAASSSGVTEEVTAEAPEESGIPVERLALLERMVERDVAQGFPGAQLAVMKDGVLVYEKAWGTTCIEHPLVNGEVAQVPVTSDTLFDLASVTKMFGVNYALQKLVTDGVISFDDTVASFLGESFLDHTEERRETDAETMRKWKEEITLRDLMHHSAGCPADPRSFGFYLDTILHSADREEILQALYRVPLVYAPGTDAVYSDMDYMLLGLVVEQVTGKDLDTYLKESFCTPLGLSHITYTPLEHGFSKEQIAATALTGNTLDGRVRLQGLRAHTLQGEVHDENAWYAMGGVSGHAGLFGNATDLAKLASLMLDGEYEGQRFFSEEVIRAVTAKGLMPEAGWGLGWWYMEDGGRGASTAFGHNGFTGTIVRIDPEEKLVIVYLTNRINSPVVQDPGSEYLFTGSRYTSASLNTVLNILVTGTMPADVLSADARFSEYLPLLEGKRVALYANHTAVVKDAGEKKHLADALLEREVRLVQVFAPEHGFRGERQAGEAVADGTDAQTGLPVISLYGGAQNAPTEEQMAAFDVLLVDIQDVGCRFYTYYITMLRLLEACAAYGKEVILLDRPNPNGHFVDGPLLQDGFASGVGVIPIPVVHGMTLGEMAQMIKGEGWMEHADALKLTVIPCQGYTHDTPVDITTAPSPALQDTRAVLLYPSLCFFENSAVSVGRGTDMAFTVYGSPYLAGAGGFDFSFTPEASSGQPFAGEACAGRDLRSLPMTELRAKGAIDLSYLLEAYRAMKAAHPEISFFGQADAKGRTMADYLFGTDEVRRLIEEGAEESAIRASWEDDVASFLTLRALYLLYP
ncbi:MAG: DUF1343 domain-containing protein [Lachnospiraceae bacterium]|nr:DUF1343 domain-containing protein [Lachnospiraceae bacterium]